MSTYRKIQNWQQPFAPIQQLKWLFFDLNSYFASVEQQENPELFGQPVAVVPMMTDSTCAIAASYEAKAYGIKTGTKIFKAKTLCPQLKCVQARHDIYVDYHHRIFEELENHTHVTRVCSIDEAACMLMGDECIRENAIDLALRIKEGLCNNIGLAITCSIGIAPNAFLAKIATDMQKPDGLVVLEPGAYKERLFEMELRDLPGINTRMEARLNLARIFTVEQFWNLDPKHARQIWHNVEGERFWYRLHGYEIPHLETHKSVVGHSRVLDPALRHPDDAIGIARQLTVKAAARLRRYEMYGRQFCLSVKSVDRIKWSGKRSFSPAQDNFTFVRALEEMWAEMVSDLRKKKLQKLSITIYDLYEKQDITLDLFEKAEPDQELNTTLSSSMDRLNKRYGVNTVSMGSCPKTSGGYVGTKIAFARIPEKEEFLE
ncbi:MAG: DNA polymerase Y family protein [Methyloligellaceae bacterium]